MARMKSLEKDQNDLSKLKYGRFSNVGECVASEFYQSNPFFFTREGANLPLTGLFRGRSAFLIASGPSFMKLDRNLLKLPGIWTMTLNNAVTSFRGNAAIVVDEPQRFNLSLWVDPSIMKFVPMSLMDKQLWDNRFLPASGGQQWAPAGMTLGDCPNMIGYRRNEKFVAERFLYEDTINWGNHKKWGGGRSVMLAALRIMFLLGFRKVYLLGVDFEMNEEKKYHFDEERTPNAIRGNMSTYEKLMQWFKELQPFFLAENFIVKNCNSESKLKAFPFISYEDAIREATAETGDPSKEQTRGMYTKYEEKMVVLEEMKKAKAPKEVVAPTPPLNPALQSNVIASKVAQVVYQAPQNTPSQSQNGIVVNQNLKPILKPIGIDSIKMN